MDPTHMLWSGWGDPGRAAPLPGLVTGVLAELLGVRPADGRPVELADVEPRAHRLTADAEEALTRIVGAGHVLTDAESRVRHTRGKSTTDLLRIRAGAVDDAPDAVVVPADHDEVLAVLRACSQYRVAVVPFGGGTSVVGGLTPGTHDCFIALDLRGMNRLTDLDTISRTAVLQPGLRGPEAEALLAEQGFTLGHFPQSYEWGTIGGFAAARSSGQASAGYGRFDDMVTALRVATPEGTLDIGRAPRSAAGPDLRQLVLGSEGAFGVITSVTVRVHPAPETRAYEGWRFGSFAAGREALRALAQNGAPPTVLRLSDETETAIGLADPGSIGTVPGTASDPGTGPGCLAVVGYEGTAVEVSERRARTQAELRDRGGVFLGEAPGEKWAEGRFSAPYLRDALLDIGAFAETLETAAFWSGIPALHENVRSALTTTLAGAGTPPVVMCHVSHVYPTGASLYFTVLCAQGEDPVANWALAKRAAGEAILASGGTISHHHGVGTDHRDGYAQEIGPLGVEILHAVKGRLDPSGILNPGILLPPMRPPATGA
ncbi:FAD-binding oxidoreductase [Streptomyces sp. NPDC056835]|uniref:FAD-binding oxidoreductase n=1 Tax=Streptomyces sp. NPDC056835 TaxID=3345956 RepID=UPI0036CEA36A